MMIALHGFLGLPADLKKLFPHAICPNLFDSVDPFEKWSETFNAQVEKGALLVGYSLGGRLALHALTRGPSLYKAAIIVSTNPGLSSGHEERIANDEAWAKRFEEESWDDVLEAWNSQGVFSNSMQREEADFSKKALAKSLRVWSLGVQENLTDQLAALPLPILWVTGEKDQKFTTLSNGLTFSHPLSRKCVLKNVGHRALFEAPEQFLEEVNQFLGEIHDSSCRFVDRAENLSRH